jgi:hypothetical protein
MAELNFRPDYFPVLKEIRIKFIPHKEQRWGMTGEWWISVDEAGVIEVRISFMGDLRCELLHAVHEVIEIATSIMSREAMSDEITDAYDQGFFDRQERKELRLGDYEPGFGEGCPYGHGHHFGTGAEMNLCPWMKLNWIDYDARVEEVAEGKVFDF